MVCLVWATIETSSFSLPQKIDKKASCWKNEMEWLIKHISLVIVCSISVIILSVEQVKISSNNYDNNNIKKKKIAV